MSPTVTTEGLSGMGDYFCRVFSAAREYASRSAQYQIESATMKRVAAVNDLGNQSFTENWPTNFRTVFVHHGGEMLRTQTFVSGSGANFLQIARELLEAHGDGILIVAKSMDSAILCQQIPKLDAQIPVILADWGATERLIELGGRAVEGVTVVETFDRNCGAPR